jgi:hypothetical protein
MMADNPDTSLLKQLGNIGRIAINQGTGKNLITGSENFPNHHQRLGTSTTRWNCSFFAVIVF